MKKLITDESRSRGSITGHYTKFMKNTSERHLWILENIFDRERRESYRDIASMEFKERMDIYEYAHYHRNFNRLLRICDIQEREIVALKDKKDTYNKMNFETYENNDDVACPVCMDDIHQKNFVYVSKCCKKPIHAHCMLYLEDKERCCLCRGKL